MNKDDMPSPWWAPARYADRRPFLRARAALTRSLRVWFQEQGFTEIESGILQVSPGNETHLHALSTQLMLPSGEYRPLYFRTSPEFACKKLLAAGEQKIVEFARVFRDREHSDLHLSEFTMLEWYRASEDYKTIINDCLVVITEAARTCATRSFSFRGKTVDPLAAPEWLTVSDAFSRFAGIDLLATVADGYADRTMLANTAAHCVKVVVDDTWSDIFSKVLVEHIEPQLGQGQLTVLYEYPLPEAALACIKPSDPRVAQRFEIYACGVELSNGFAELIDTSEQRRRFMQAMDEKERRYGERYPLDEDLLAAIAQMPPASGVALGFDRLVMLATGAPRIDQVVWAPLEMRA